MGLVLTFPDWQDVRAALDVSLDTSSLPDATIARSIFAGRANRWIAAMVDYDVLSADAKLQARDAAVLYLASLIATRIPDLTAENQQGVGGYSRAAMDWQARAAELAEEAMATLPSSPIVVSTPAVPPVFRLARGRRGY